MGKVPSPASSVTSALDLAVSLLLGFPKPTVSAGQAAALGHTVLASWASGATELVSLLKCIFALLSIRVSGLLLEAT